jgi:hypothetical protein
MLTAGNRFVVGPRAAFGRPPYCVGSTAKSRPEGDDRRACHRDHHGVLRLSPSALDYAIIAVYFLVVLGIGGVARLSIKTDMIAWALMRPVRPEPPETRGQGSGRIRRAPAT